MRTRITKRVVDALELPANGQRERLWDTEVSGFGVVRSWTGSTSFVARYRIRGRVREVTLGEYGPLTVEAARRKAISVLGAAVDGADPLQEREANRAMPTFAQWAEEYLKGAELRKSRRAIYEDRRYLVKLCDRWGKRPLDSITTDDVQRLSDHVADRGKTTANRWLASVRACFSDAWRREIIPTNPVARVRPMPENQPRDRVLTDDELRRFAKALDGVTDPHLRAAFRMLIETGCRKSELLRAKWCDFDLDKAIWRLPKTKAGRPQVIPLVKTTAAMLRTLPRVGEFLIPGRFDQEKGTYQQREDLKRPWQKLCAQAKLDGVTIHDLRRTYGLHVARTAGIRAASKLLRHSDLRMTDRVYAPFDLDEARAAAEKAARARNAVVLPLRKARR